jgi:hypothetical protein
MTEAFRKYDLDDEGELIELRDRCLQVGLKKPSARSAEENDLIAQRARYKNKLYAFGRVQFVRVARGREQKHAKFPIVDMFKHGKPSLEK